MRRTVLHGRHVAAGARLADFAGWELPLAFAGTVAEHRAVRERVGVFDVSHLGSVHIEGPGADAIVDATLTNDPARLGDGEGQYTLLCDEHGGIVDDLLLYRFDATRFLAVPNAANTAAVAGALEAAGRAVDADAHVRTDAPDRALLAVQGPDALDVTAAVLSTLGAPGALDGLAYLGIREVVTAVADAPLIVCRSGYTGERGVELVAPAELAPALWDALIEAGVEPCGLGARDTLRLEMGYPLHGNELSLDVRPDEAGLLWAVRPVGRAFPGQGVLADAAEAAAPSRRSVGLVTDGRRPARAGMRVLAGGRDVGVVTSGTFSPTLEHGIALALVDAGIPVGTTVEVDLRGTIVPHEVVRPPFVERDPRR
jgi:aminomethyltransferase